jgi:hypothetical protein
MRLMIFVAAALLASCSKAPEVAAAPPTAPYIIELDALEIMVHAMDPAARQFWKGWGEEYSDAGLVDVSAKTDDEWKSVEDGATGVVLAANTLMLPAYQRQPASEWNKYARDIADLAMLGREGADAHDRQAMEDIGIRMTAACNACHDAFIPAAAEPASVRGARSSN